MALACTKVGCANFWSARATRTRESMRVEKGGWEKEKSALSFP